MSKQTDMLQALIERSCLLDADHRQKLLAAMPSLTPDQQSGLETILRDEPAIMERITASAVRGAAERGDDAFFKKLDVLFADGSRMLLQAEESVDREGETKNLDTFFDGV